MPAEKIVPIPSEKIDREKWDACVSNSHNPLIYARSFYLDHISDNWSGLVLNDYEAVMPICWRKKFRIQYFYDVPFIQQLGIFATIDEAPTGLFIIALYEFCNYGDYAFNYQIEEMEKAISCNNYILPLHEEYLTIQKNYSNDLKNNLKKAEKENLIYTKEDIEPAFHLFKKLYHKRFPHVRNKDFARFLQLAQYLQQSGSAFARKVTNNKNETLATALLFKDENRIYNIMNSIPDAGRKTSANHFLFDNIIWEFSGQPLVLDFEGSDIEGIGHFYENFGSINQPYYKIHYNNLPRLLKFLKR
jgi:hypothetical protein